MPIPEEQLPRGDRSDAGDVEKTVEHVDRYISIIDVQGVERVPSTLDRYISHAAIRNLAGTAFGSGGPEGPICRTDFARRNADLLRRPRSAGGPAVLLRVVEFEPPAGEQRIFAACVVCGWAISAPVRGVPQSVDLYCRRCCSTLTVSWLLASKIAEDGRGDQGSAGATTGSDDTIVYPIDQETDAFAILGERRRFLDILHMRVVDNPGDPIEEKLQIESSVDNAWKKAVSSRFRSDAGGHLSMSQLEKIEAGMLEEARSVHFGREPSVSSAFKGVCKCGHRGGQHLGPGMYTDGLCVADGCECLGWRAGAPDVASVDQETDATDKEDLGRFGGIVEVAPPLPNPTGLAVVLAARRELEESGADLESFDGLHLMLAAVKRQGERLRSYAVHEELAASVELIGDALASVGGLLATIALLADEARARSSGETEEAEEEAPLPVRFYEVLAERKGAGVMARKHRGRVEGPGLGDEHAVAQFAVEKLAETVRRGKATFECAVREVFVADPVRSGTSKVSVFRLLIDGEQGKFAIERVEDFNGGEEPDGEQTKEDKR